MSVLSNVSTVKHHYCQTLLLPNVITVKHLFTHFMAFKMMYFCNSFKIPHAYRAWRLPTYICVISCLSIHIYMHQNPKRKPANIIFSEICH